MCSLACHSYVNMDYIVLQTLARIVYALVLLSYDIACQYSKNFWKRVEDFPPDMRLDRTRTTIKWAIPKKHYAVHGPNHSHFSLNFQCFCGRTCGEGIESCWHIFNAIAAATIEMGPALRHETLNDHWGAWNWEKILLFGM